jgi:hypothetical protein
VRELREYERVLVGFMKLEARQLAVCVRNTGCRASLEVGKVYPLLKDVRASELGLVRVTDEFGEDYLFPEQFFVPVKWPRSAERAELKLV